MVEKLPAVHGHMLVLSSIRWSLSLKDGLAIGVALLHFCHRIGALIRILNVGRDVPLPFLQQFQSRFERCVALSPGYVGPLVLFAILDVDRNCTIVILFQEW